VNESITLDASGSSDEGSITEYRWDFDGDGTVDRNTTSATVEYTYTEAGDVEPTVTVVDDDNATDTASAPVSVTEPEPALDASISVGTESPTTNESVTFDAGASAPTDAIVSYEWTFGDDENATGETVEHAYAEPGTYTVTLEVESSAGEVAEANTPPSTSRLPTVAATEVTAATATMVATATTAGIATTTTVAVPTTAGTTTLVGNTGGGNNNAGGGGGGGGGGAVGGGGGGGGSSEPADPAEPDIGPANVSVSDRTLVAGDSLVVDATLTNDGDAAGEREVELAVDGTVVESRTLVLEPNETRTLTFTRQFATPGNRTVSVGDTAVTVTVEAAEPNISVAGVEQSNDSVFAGEPFQLTAHVQNTGTAAGTTTVELELFGGVVDTQEVSVPAGETVSVTFTRQIEAPGSYTASVGNATVSLQVDGQSTTTPGSTTTTSSSSDVLSPGFGPTVAVLALALAAAGRFLVRRKE